MYFECFRYSIHVLPQSLECRNQCDLPKSLGLCILKFSVFVLACPIYLNRFLCMYFECFSNNIHVLPQSLECRDQCDLSKSLGLCILKFSFFVLACPIYLNRLDSVYFECFSNNIYVLPWSLDCRNQCDLPKSLGLCILKFCFLCWPVRFT